MDLDKKIDVAISEDNKAHVSTWIQGTVWFVSMASVPIYFFHLLKRETDGEKLLAIAAFGIVSFVQLILIYFDIHSFENKLAKAKEEYGDWINKLGEKIFRYLILLFLLFGAGEITEAIHPWFSNAGEIGSRGNFCEFIKPDGKIHSYLFVLGASLVFIFIILWNVFALKYRKTINTLEKTRKAWTTTRIWFFLVSAVFALCFWLIMLFDTKGVVGMYALPFVVIYLISALIATLLSFKSTQDLLIKTYGQK
jgi:hypothetical protein